MLKRDRIQDTWIWNGEENEIYSCGILHVEEERKQRILRFRTEKGMRYTQ